jgi:hypothetical protein
MIRRKPWGWATLKSAYDNSIMELIALLKSKDDPFLRERYYDADLNGFYEHLFS